MALLEETEVELKQDLMVLHGLDEALLGVSDDLGTMGLIYSKAVVISILMERDGMTLSEAEEFFGFNIAPLSAMENGPIFLREIEPEERDELRKLSQP